jgi:hypothetical protein
MTKGKSKPSSTENLVQPTSTGSVELAESDLDKVSGGKNTGAQPQEYLKIKLTDILIS